MAHNARMVAAVYAARAAEDASAAGDTAGAPGEYCKAPANEDEKAR